MPEKTVQKEPGKKPAPSKKPKPQQEVVVQIPLSELHPFPDHPFQVREDGSNAIAFTKDISSFPSTITLSSAVTFTTLPITPQPYFPS